MSRFAKDAGGEYQDPPIGTHSARCISIVDLGTQRGEYQGQPTVRNQVLLTFELPAELRHDGKPFTASKFYTNSLNEKAKLRHDLQAWRGRAFTAEELKGFDLASVLGKPCMVTVIEGDNGKRKLGAVTSVPKGMEVGAATNPLFSFWIEAGAMWDETGFQALSEGLQKIVMASDEYKARTSGPSEFDSNGHSVSTDDDIPF